MSTTPQPSPEQTIDEILHAIISIGILAASIFVKNPNSQKQAGQIIGLVQNVVLPIADAHLNPNQPTAGVTSTPTQGA